MDAPFSYFGGKSKLAPWIVRHIPTTFGVYCELFGGSFAIALAKHKPHGLEVYNDAHSGVTNFFRVLRDPDLQRQLLAKLDLTPHSREVWRECHDTWEQLSDPVDKAWAWYVCQQQSFAGKAESWGFNVSTPGRSRQGPMTGKWGHVAHDLAPVAARLRDLQVEHGPWDKCFDTYDGPDTVFVADPPYVPDTRRAGEYAHEMTLGDHERMVQKFLGAQGGVILCGYDHQVYDPLVRAGWTKLGRRMVCHAVGKTRASGRHGVGEGALQDQMREERLWISPKARVQDMFSEFGDDEDVVLS